MSLIAERLRRKVIPLSVPPRFVLLASDETEISTTSTTYTLAKWFRLTRLLEMWSRLYIQAEGYVTAPNRLDLEVRIGGIPVSTLSWTETTYTIKSAMIPIRLGFGLCPIPVEFFYRVSGGTGYLRVVEVYGEG